MGYLESAGVCEPLTRFSGYNLDEGAKIKDLSKVIFLSETLIPINFNKFNR